MDRSKPRPRQPPGSARSATSGPVVARAADSAAEVLRWLNPTQPPPGRPHFLPCCPCRSALDDLACTPRWCFSYRYLDWLLTISVVLIATWSALLFSVGPDL
ncbi:uncharacterized protein LOC127749297 [Frankliniella occidentalis]|uniref:Uncharacterized protein LOC127749297 n=1 Tax=Frankliniella occidentalis TaxID=133901 RepID=A0A9C6U6S2_FRAOC|nr:uncharacterized protein LOC127749297 [Frankliniella occidentalis]